MRQLKHCRMQKISIERERCWHTCRPALVRLRSQLARSAVERVAHHRMPKRRHVHANLMRASSLDLELDQRKLAVRRIDFSLHYVMRYRVAATVAPRRHARAALGVAADGALNRAAILLRPAVDERDIGLMHLSRAELLREAAMRFIVFRHHHQPTGRAVEAMHDPGTKFAADCRKRSKVMQQRIDQGSAPVLETDS